MEALLFNVRYLLSGVILFAGKLGQHFEVGLLTFERRT